MGAEVTILDVNLNQLAYLDDVFLGRVGDAGLGHARTSPARCARRTSSSAACSSPAARRRSSSREELIARDEPGLGGRRRRGGPGRLHRDLPADHPRQPDLRGARRRPLLRRQHARRGAPDLHLRAHQHHPALRPEDRRPGPGRGRQVRTRRWPAGLNTYDGHVTYEAVAQDLGYAYVPMLDAIGARAASPQVRRCRTCGGPARPCSSEPRE